MPSLQRPVLDPPPADPERARAHFARLLELETDCWDVHAAMQRPRPGFVLVDVRSPTDFAAGHVPGAHNLPHARITARTLDELPAADLHVVYCAGPHCNGADRAALRLATLGGPSRRCSAASPGGSTRGSS